MPGRDVPGQLSNAVALVRSRISKHRGDRGFNEQNTKASLIEPVLQALGWDTNDSDEVHREYRAKSKYNPVDFALLIARAPCLLFEGKALRDSLNDDKVLVQILAYASATGVQWVVLSNGDEYRIYNAAAPVPAEEKLFRKVLVSGDDLGSLMATLTLLSKDNLQDKRILRLWESDFVDRQVRGAIEEIFNPAEPATALVHVIGKRLLGRLKDSQIAASLRRVRLTMDFPAEPDAVAPRPTAATVKGTGATSAEAPTGRSDRAVAKSEVSLQMLIHEGLLPVPAQIFTRYRGQDLSAIVESDGTVIVEGVSCSSLSAAGGEARKHLYRGNRKEPATNGWTFWLTTDPTTKQDIAVDALRDRYLQRKKDEARRFGKPAN